MTGFICKVCSFISIDEEAPDKCPVCGAPKSSFEQKSDAIKIPQDANNLTELEKKHVPVVSLVKKCGLIPEGCFDLHVMMGQIQHPMQPEHSILHIDFYIDNKFVSRIKLTPQKLNPAVGLHLKPGAGKLSVVSLCNLHGAWINEAIT